MKFTVERENFREREREDFFLFFIFCANHKNWRLNSIQFNSSKYIQFIKSRWGSAMGGWWLVLIQVFVFLWVNGPTKPTPRPFFFFFFKMKTNFCIFFFLAFLVLNGTNYGINGFSLFPTNFLTKISTIDMRKINCYRKLFIFV